MTDRLRFYGSLDKDFAVLSILSGRKLVSTSQIADRVDFSHKLTLPESHLSRVRYWLRKLAVQGDIVRHGVSHWKITALGEDRLRRLKLGGIRKND